MAMKKPSEDNYMVKKEVVEENVKEAGFAPIVDMYSDTLGSNSLAPLYYSAREDAKLQQKYIEGNDAIINP